jgi:hypothetical protein
MMSIIMYVFLNLIFSVIIISDLRYWNIQNQNAKLLLTLILFLNLWFWYLIKNKVLLYVVAP